MYIYIYAHIYIYIYIYVYMFKYAYAHNKYTYIVPRCLQQLMFRRFPKLSDVAESFGPSSAKEEDPEERSVCYLSHS